MQQQNFLGSLITQSVYIDFFLQRPVIESIDPDYGPFAGGTVLTLQGENLGVGNRNNENITSVTLQPGDISCNNSRFYPNIPEGVMIR